MPTLGVVVVRHVQVLVGRRHQQPVRSVRVVRNDPCDRSVRVDAVHALDDPVQVVPHLLAFPRSEPRVAEVHSPLRSIVWSLGESNRTAPYVSARTGTAPSASGCASRKLSPLGTVEWPCAWRRPGTPASGSSATAETTSGFWSQDDARIGQKGILTRVWAAKNTRPRIPHDHRYGCCYLYAAACRERQVAVGLVAPRANSEYMKQHLAAISGAVDEGAFEVVVLDGAGWHKSKDLKMPENPRLLVLPIHSPELNPMVRVFQHLKAIRFASRVFETVC